MLLNSCTVLKTMVRGVFFPHSNLRQEWEITALAPLLSASPIYTVTE